MKQKRQPDWDPRASVVQRDQRAAYDEMRRRCPVAWSDYQGWSLFRHADVLRVLHDHDSFSNAVSRHISVPNGMDPPEHGPYRAMIEPYFFPERIRAFEPRVRDITRALLAKIREDETEVMADLALPFAARAQCKFLGWPSTYADRLINWNHRNHAATLAADRPAMARIAVDFRAMVDELLDARQDAPPESDLTAALMHERVNGQPLDREAITSLLRNWTVGEVGTISASVGILVDVLIQEAGLLSWLKRSPAHIPMAVDEVLRRHGPLGANRRVATRDVELGGRLIRKGERLSLNWVAANRDPEAHKAPDELCFDRSPADNLLYGAGIHVCPGAGLARMELRVFMESLLTQIKDLQPARRGQAELAVFPASGFARLPVSIRMT
ncbi:cytochrome P450 [Natronospira proteinivora]|uniref:Cytochrome P450 n=1 Tax=Natronospira proteinivora TaxID=1807133 RepID=A0ABT1G7A5_9GAMM|nr:cytochrome P450 [Natronospira proteinivora]MCP1727183.1 cytochrome P450 [Natronospira proteinivora]